MNYWIRHNGIVSLHADALITQIPNNTRMLEGNVSKITMAINESEWDGVEGIGRL